jgi:hypothetical protein
MGADAGLAARAAHRGTPPARRALIAGGLVTFIAPAAALLLVVAAVLGPPPSAGAGELRYGASAFALRDIPPDFLALYQEAAEHYGLDWAVLAAIGKIETDHQRAPLPGVRSGVNRHGCCGGPMQFWIAPPHPNTWDRYGLDGDRDGRRDPHDPADAIPAAARYLRASGAPGDYQRALFAYNHATWYVDDVLAMSGRYRGDAQPGNLAGDAPAAAEAADEILTSRRVIIIHAAARADVASGRLDPRVLRLLAWIARRHDAVVTAIASDHRPGTNHEAGRAFDIGAVDGQICTGTRTGACGRLALELVRIGGSLRPSELIYCFDPDGPDDPRGLARADHCDHLHAGWDA